MSNNVSMNLAFIIAVGFALTSVYYIHTSAPETPAPLKFFVAPLAICYLVIEIMNRVLPNLSLSSIKMQHYMSNRTMDTLSNTGYIQIFPPLFVVLLVVMILFYSSRI